MAPSSSASYQKLMHNALSARWQEKWGVAMPPGQFMTYFLILLFIHHQGLIRLVVSWIYGTSYSLGIFLSKVICIALVFFRPMRAVAGMSTKLSITSYFLARFATTNDLLSFFLGSMLYLFHGRCIYRNTFSSDSVGYFRHVFSVSSTWLFSSTDQSVVTRFATMAPAWTMTGVLPIGVDITIKIQAQS